MKSHPERFIVPIYFDTTVVETIEERTKEVHMCPREVSLYQVCRYATDTDNTECRKVLILIL